MPLAPTALFSGSHDRSLARIWAQHKLLTFARNTTHTLSQTLKHSNFRQVSPAIATRAQCCMLLAFAVCPMRSRNSNCSQLGVLQTSCMFDRLYL